jgi:hypothetical protein
MANIKTVEYESKDLSLLFGSRWYRNAKHQLKFKTFEDITDRIADFDTEFIAGLLFEAHKEACFFKQTELNYNNIDVFYNVVDEIGMVKVAELIIQSIIELSGYNRLDDSEKAKLEEQGKELLKKKEQMKSTT